MMGHDEMGDKVESESDRDEDLRSASNSAMREPMVNPEDPDDVLIETVLQEGIEKDELWFNVDLLFCLRVNK